MRRLGALLLVLSLAACIPQSSKKKPARAAGGRPAAAAPAAPSAAAQKRSYDLGVKHFGEENYVEAQKAWQETVRLGPGTPLGRKAQENLQKVNAILSSLRDLERQ